MVVAELPMGVEREDGDNGEFESHYTSYLAQWKTTQEGTRTDFIFVNNDWRLPDMQTSREQDNGRPSAITQVPGW
jgi:hypothetical protein